MVAPIPANLNLKRKAYRIYRDALKNGSLVRADACSMCGASGVRIEGHHFDYAKPLEVVWLCSKCHYGFHDYNRFFDLGSRAGRGRIHSDDKARKRAWWNKHRAKNK